MMRKIVLIAMTLIAVMNIKAVENHVSRLDSLMNANYDADSPGAALVIAVGDSIIYERYIGLADVERMMPITDATRFNIASISKQFTAVSILQLAEAGKLDIDMPVALYFPELHGGIWQEVTLRHLMSHSSGIADARPRDNREWMIRATDSESLEYLPSLERLKFSPGTAYDYINPTFVLLGRIIESRSGKDFETYQHEHLFEPAGIQDICYFSPEREIPSMAHGYEVNDGVGGGESDNGIIKNREQVAGCYTDKQGVEWVEYDYGEETFFATRPDGGIYASARALLQWERALRSGRLITGASLNEARKEQVTVSGSPWCTYQNRPDTYYGLGWFIDKAPGREVKIYHTGDNGGFQAYLGTYPSSEVTVVMLENRNNLDRWSMQLEIEAILQSSGFIH